MELAVILHEHVNSRLALYIRCDLIHHQLLKPSPVTISCRSQLTVAAALLAIQV